MYTANNFIAPFLFTSKTVRLLYPNGKISFTLIVCNYQKSSVSGNFLNIVLEDATKEYKLEFVSNSEAKSAFISLKQAIDALKPNCNVGSGGLPNVAGRFGIEDNFGVQTRSIDMQNHLLEVFDASTISFRTKTTNPLIDTNFFINSEEVKLENLNLKIGEVNEGLLLGKDNGAGKPFVKFSVPSGSVTLKPAALNQGPYEIVLPNFGSGAVNLLLSVNGLTADGNGNLVLPTGVNSDWNATSGPSFILNKPVLATVATTGSYTSLTNLPIIPTRAVIRTYFAVSNVGTGNATYDNTTGVINIPSPVPTVPQVNSDWNSTSGVSQILNKPVIASTAYVNSQLNLKADKVTTITINGVTQDLSQNRIFNVSSSQWITTGSDIYYNTGKVLVGGTIPTAGIHKLEVQGDVKITNALYIDGQSSSLTLADGAYIYFGGTNFFGHPTGLVGPNASGASMGLRTGSGGLLFSNGGNPNHLIKEGLALFTDNTASVSLTATSSTAILEVQSTTKGVLISRMTTGQRNAITTPTTSLLLYDTTLSSFQYYTGTGWSPLGAIDTTANYNWTGIHTFTKNLNDAVLTVQNTQPYGTGSVFTQYTQKWLTSSGTLAGYVMGDIQRLVMNGMVESSQHRISGGDGTIDSGQITNGIGIAGNSITFWDRIYAGGGRPVGRWFADIDGGLVIQTVNEVSLITSVPSSSFTVKSTTKGTIPAPRMTTTERDAIISPAIGLQIYNTITNQPNFYNGTGWSSSGSQWTTSGSNIYYNSGNVLIGTIIDDGVGKLQVNGILRLGIHSLQDVVQGANNSLNLGGVIGAGSDRALAIYGTATGLLSIAIGNSNTATNSGTAIGGYGTTATGGIAIGNSIIATTAVGNNTVAIGSGVSVFGGNAVGINGNVGSLSNPSSGVAIFGTVGPSILNGAIAIMGHAAANQSIALYGTSTATNEFVAGSAYEALDMNNFAIKNVYFGSGKTRENNSNTQNIGDGIAYTINGSGAFGTNYAGGNISIAGGKGTGSGLPGFIMFQTTSVLGSGTTLQTLTERMRIVGTNGNVGIGTTNPLAKLDVNGDIHLSGAGAPSTNSLFLNQGRNELRGSFNGLIFNLGSGSAIGTPDSSKSYSFQNRGNVYMTMVSPSTASAYGIITMNTDLKISGNTNVVTIDSLKTSIAPPATSGTVKMVITDVNGKLSSQTIQASPAGAAGLNLFNYYNFR